MTTVFCPGHITCFFRPVITDNEMTTGSIGVGMKISLGSEVTVEERNDRRISITLNGEPSRIRIIEHVAGILASDKGFDVTVCNDLPVSQGFGMSAAGAIATGMCITNMFGYERERAFEAAHIAEVKGKGGLGDVLGIMNCGYISVRTKAGIPPAGEVAGKGKAMRIALAVIGEPVSTGNVLSDDDVMKRIMTAGDEAMVRYQGGCGLFETARIFSQCAGLETQDMSSALDRIGKDAAMCMLGNSLFSMYPEDVLADVLTDAEVYTCETTDSLPVIRRA